MARKSAVTAEASFAVVFAGLIEALPTVSRFSLRNLLLLWSLRLVLGNASRRIGDERPGL
jgi:hypothetical protein